MSHTLTEADVFTPTVVVPDGVDSGAHRAEDVQALGQALADRTRNLKNLLDALGADAALKSATNTFITQQLINTPVDLPMLSTGAKPGDYTGAMPDPPGLPPSANRWKLVLAFPTTASAYIGLFVGQPPDGFAIVNNARWHPQTQKWRQLDTSKPSAALFSYLDSSPLGRMLTSMVGAGAAPWADWPTTAGADLYVGGSVGASGNVSVTGDFRYTPGHARTNWSVPLAGGSGQLKLNDDGTYSSASGAASVEFPLRIPGGVTISDITVLYDQSNASQYGGLALRRRSHSTTSMPVWETIPAGSFVNTGGIGFHATPIATNGVVIDGAYDYAVLVQFANANDKLGRIYVDWTDPGPLNLG